VIGRKASGIGGDSALGVAEICGVLTDRLGFVVSPLEQPDGVEPVEPLSTPGSSQHLGKRRQGPPRIGRIGAALH
jgi:hypothetical protein